MKQGLQHGAGQCSFADGRVYDGEWTDGKMTAEALENAITGAGIVHHTQPAAVSVTQVTEAGTLYTLDELTGIAEICRKLGLKLHMDGARLSNAAVSLHVPVRAFTVDAGVDLVSFGLTKNGAMAAESIIVLNGDRVEGVDFLRKTSMQLASKMRFLSAQFVAMLTDDLWLRSAGHANAMASRLHDGVGDLSGVTITQPVDANAVFVLLPEQVASRLQERFHFYTWDQSTGEVRWMCAWDTTEGDVDDFVAAVRGEIASGA